MVLFSARGIIHSPPRDILGGIFSPKVDSTPSQKPSRFGAFGVDVSDEALEREFAAVDRDGSGKVSAEEMKRAFQSSFSKAGKQLPPKLVDDLMAEADVDGDGGLDLCVRRRSIITQR